METHFQVDSRPMTPDEVLEVLRSWTDDDAGSSITFDTTVREWINCLNDDWIDDPAPSLNLVFETSPAKAEWKQVLRPEKTRHLRDLCEFIAARATIPTINPVAVFGRPCLPAGAFRTLKAELARRGADVQDLGPSTVLEPFLKRNAEAFFGVFAKLAPRVLSLHRTEDRLCFRFFRAMCLIGIPTMFLGFLAEWACWQLAPFAVALGAALLLIGYLGSSITGSLRPRRAWLEGLVTFRDLITYLLNPKWR